MIIMSEIKNEVAVQEEKELAVAGPLDMRGYEDMDMGDLTLPVIKVMQPTSPELSDEDYDLRMGDIINSLTMEKVSTFIPLKFSRTRTMFVPREEAPKKEMVKEVKRLMNVDITDEELSGMFICRADDNKFGDKFGSCANCPLGKFDNSTGRKPLCNANINTVALFGNSEGLDVLPSMIRFSTTSLKHGEQFYKLTLMLGRGGPLFRMKYKLVSEKKQDNGKTWYEIKAKPAGKVKDGALAQAEGMYNMITSSTVVASDEVVEEKVEEKVVEVVNEVVNEVVEEVKAAEKSADKQEELEF